jgi:glycerophosphoryl diester phosphodiesterase
VLVYGHRGTRGRLPENTLEAFEYAIGVGTHGIEMDVALTRDDVPVISHDPWLAGGTAIRTLEWRDLHERAPSIPTLAKVLALPGAFQFLIEVKSFPKRPELTASPEAFAALVLREIDARGVGERSIVQSFDFRILHAMEQLAPGIPRGALFERGDDFVTIARQAKAGIAVPEFHLVTPERVRATHTAGLEVYTWTPNRAADWSAMCEARVDAVITDDPAGLAGFLS